MRPAHGTTVTRTIWQARELTASPFFDGSRLDSGGFELASNEQIFPDPEAPTSGFVAFGDMIIPRPPRQRRQRRSLAFLPRTSVRGAVAPQAKRGHRQGPKRAWFWESVSIDCPCELHAIDDTLILEVSVTNKRHG
jgi:hypothetical protein